MKPSAVKSAYPWLLTAGLIALLLILASLQYRWLSEVSEADREKTRDVLQTAVVRFAEDFDRELTRAFVAFLPQPGFRSRDVEGFAVKFDGWQAVAPYPDLVRAVFMAGISDDGELELDRFDPVAGSFGASPWPADLDGLHQRLVEAFSRRSLSEPPGSGFSFLADDVPAVILPMFGAPPPGDPGRPEGPPPRSRGFLVVWLDRVVITRTILPQLTERHLRGADGSGYNVRVEAMEDQRPIFLGGAEMEGMPAGDGDASTPLFSLLPADQLGTVGLDPGWGRPGPDGRRGSRFGDGRRGHRLYGWISRASGARWRLVVSHPAGSLDAAVARAHRSNLAVSFGILLLLGGSLMLMLLSTRRVQALARQQLDFVAAVTHELLTPLAAMRSAGQNLADGVVEDRLQVKRYGRLIDDEGRRLTSMVGQVLELAGMQAGGRTYSLRRTALPELIDGALAEYKPVLDEEGFEVEKRIANDLPEIMADPPAMRRAIQNLIANAVKYGAEGSWIGIGARCVEGPQGPELQLSVEDRGPGIAAADLPRLFEPFYRGRNGSRDQIPGSGLGLSLVKHIVEGHGGRVVVETSQGEGSKLTLSLPAAADEIDVEESNDGPRV